MVKRFSKGWQSFIALCIHIILSFFMVVIILKGFQLAMRVKEQLSPGMESSMTFPYLSVPIHFIVMLIFILNHIYLRFKKGAT